MLFDKLTVEFEDHFKRRLLSVADGTFDGVYCHRFFFFFFFFFFNCYLAAPRPTSGHYRGDSLTHPMLITAFLHIRPEGHREPRSEVGSLSPAERLVGFEPGTFRF